MPRALLSVTDKSGLVDFARGLATLGWELVSTGGTARVLRDAGLSVLDVSKLTSFPEMMGGRLKTLHPVVHGGLLARRDDAEHMRLLKEALQGPIDLLAVNLYAFRESAAKVSATPEEVIEHIDIGGPAMLRSGAKNFAAVTVIVDPADYPRVLAAFQANDDDIDLRRLLAGKAFAHTAAYDGAISTWFADQRDEHFPERISLSFERAQSLRYGENPDQKAAFYVEQRGAGLGALVQRGGKELSFNNLLDLEGALAASDMFDHATACAIIKHTTPCGIATGSSALDAYQKALACDPLSAFGSVISINVPVDDGAAEAISSLFVECLVAPSFSDAAVEILGRKKNLRILEGRARWSPPAFDYKRVRGGMLFQERMWPPTDETSWQQVTSRAVTDEERANLYFAWRAVASVKSNAIVLARNGATIGIGAGQMSRVDASFLAVHKARGAGHETQGAVLASDAYFPFRDGVDQAAEAGITAIVQPGGSVRDSEVIAAANEHGMGMLFTGRRMFRH